MSEHEQSRLLVATPDHASEIAALHGTLFEKAWDAEGVGRLLEQPACSALVALDEFEAKVIGFIVAHMAAGEGEVLSLGVKRDSHRQGVGRRLAQALIEAARRKAVQRLFLDVGESNTPAIALYDRLGFSQMGRRKAYYLHTDGTREDALLMVLKL